MSDQVERELQRPLSRDCADRSPSPILSVSQYEHRSGHLLKINQPFGQVFPGIGILSSSIMLLESRHQGLCHPVVAQTRKTAFSTVISSILEENRCSGTCLTVLSPESAMEGPNRLISIPPKRLPTMYLSPTPCTSHIYQLMCRGCAAVVILRKAVSRRLTSKTTSSYPRSRINPDRVNSQKLTFDISRVLLCLPSAIPLRIIIPPIQL